jgi:threonine dehydrogenase-like Zn-dependent dehydrogenase
MKAIVLDYALRTLAERDTPEPGRLGPNDVRFRVHEVGVCGTDRELAAFRFGFPPEGDDYLVLGHEAIGQVVETGAQVATLKPGDWVAPMIRRCCQPPCASCARGRRDLCLTGSTRERGIFGLHGYFGEYAVDDAADLVRVPAELADRAVLVEPLSVVEKAVSSALAAHRGEARSALVLGAGPIGLLAALVLRERGLAAVVASLEPRDHPRARLADRAGFEYLEAPAARKADIAIEATGSADAAFAAIRSLAPLGVCVILGASAGAGSISFTDLIVNNQTVIGSVNASPEAFELAVRDLGRFDRRTVEDLIRRAPFSAAIDSIAGTSVDAPKLVHVVAA